MIVWFWFGFGLVWFGLVVRFWFRSMQKLCPFRETVVALGGSSFSFLLLSLHLACICESAHNVWLCMCVCGCRVLVRVVGREAFGFRSRTFRYGLYRVRVSTTDEALGVSCPILVFVSTRGWTIVFPAEATPLPFSGFCILHSERWDLDCG